MGCLISFFEKPEVKSDNQHVYIRNLYDLYNIEYDTDNSEYSPPSYYSLITKGND